MQPRPWGPPPENIDRDRQEGDFPSNQYRDHSGHYASHSQYYHPEAQRRRHQQPEEFWYTQPHPHPLRQDSWKRNLPQPTREEETLHEEDFRAPPQPHTHHPLQPYSSVSSHAPVDRGHDPQPPPLMYATTTEQVSAVDMIRPHHKERSHREMQQAEARCPGGSVSPPLWLRQRGRGPIVDDRGKEEGEGGREVRDSTESTLLPVPPWLQQRGHVDDRGGEEGEEGEAGRPSSTVEPTVHPWLQQRGEEVGCGEGGVEGRQQLLHHSESVSEVSRRDETTKKCDENEEGVKVELVRAEGVEERGEQALAVGGYENSFVGEVQKFVQRNSETFDIITEKELTVEPLPTLHNLKSEESYKHAEPEAIEYHMQVDESTRRWCFFTLVEPGDVIRGHVVAKRHGGLTIQITSFVNSHKYRKLSDLSIRGVVLFENLADDHDKCEDVMRDMQLDDVVQAVVLKVELPEEIPVLSFRNNDDFPEIKTGSLGYRAGKRPVSPRSSNVTRDEFLHQLEADPGFTNPQAVPNLCQLLGLTSISPRLTLLRDILTAEYAESDFAESLRKTQRFKWSMKTVAIGVDHFKSGKHTSALDYFNHALEIDPSNVEGLVARGALAATTGKYREGLADFEKALSIKSNHRNARNYFVETQVVFGRELEVQGKIDSAMACYREALNFDPEEPTAKERLGALTVVMETKAAKQREREREEEEEKERMARLRRVIEKEKRKQLKEKRPKPKKRKKSEDYDRKKHKKRWKTSRQDDSHSEESSDSETEDEGGKKRERGGKRGREKRSVRERRREKHKKRPRHKKTKTHSKTSQKYKTSSSDESTDSDTGDEEGGRREGGGKEGRRERHSSSDDRGQYRSRTPRKRSQSRQRHHTSSEETSEDEETKRRKEGKGRREETKGTHKTTKRESLSPRQHYSSSSSHE